MSAVTSSPYDPIDRVLEKLDGVRKSHAGYTALCPAHQDRSPSLSIRRGDNGQVLIKCYAGCPTESVLQSLGLEWGDLFSHTDRTNVRHGRERSPSRSGHGRTRRTSNVQRPTPNAQAAGPERSGSPKSEIRNPKSEITRVYEYTDENLAVLFQTVRMEPKDFRQRRPDGNGGWIWNLDGVRLVPYHLVEAMASARIGELVFVVEGEKDVDALLGIGMPATCCPMGAGKWRDEYSEYLRHGQIVIIPDNDDPGRAHAEQVARSLHRIAGSIRILELPGLPPKGDVSDWLAAGGDRWALERLWEEAPLWVPSTIDIQLSAALHLTDVGNAQRLVYLHGQDMRYCLPWRSWLVWNGVRWTGEQGEVMRRAKHTIQVMYAQAEEMGDDNLMSHALRSESVMRLKAMVECAQSEIGMSIMPDDLDADPWVLNCANGTLNLRTGVLDALRRESFCTKLAPVHFDWEAQCPRWEAFLSRIMDGNESLISFLRRVVGYTLTGSTREQVLFFLYGRGRNGKSTFLETIRYMLGDYARQTDFSTFINRQNDGGPREDIAALVGSRFASAVEVESGKRLAESLVKLLTGGDRVSARRLYQERFEFVPQFKAFLAANHKPVVRGTDEGIWRRIRLIPFTVTIPDEEADRDLPEKLREELPGILRWAMDGCIEWQRKGLGMPAEVDEATSAYREEMDVFGGFIAEKCVTGPSLSASSRDLYETYRAWCIENGLTAMTKVWFGRALGEQGFSSDRLKGAAIWSGLGLA